MANQQIRLPADEPSVVDTLRRVFESAQQLVLDRLDLMRLDATASVQRTVRAGALAGVGAALLSGALCMLMIVIITLLDRVMPLPTAIMAVAGGIIAVGAVVLAVGMQRARAESAAGATLVGSDSARGESRQ